MRLFLLLLLSSLLLACASSQEVRQVVPEQANDAAHFTASDYLNKQISVTIENGLADFHNIDGFSAYEPIAFVLKPGQVVTKNLIKSGDNFFNSNGKITLHYNNGILFVDELSRENINLNYLGVQFNLNEAWLNGQTYKNVSTYGFCNLRNADVTVRIDQ